MLIGTADKDLATFLFSMMAVFFIGLFVETARRRKLHRGQTGQVQSVEFQLPSAEKASDQQAVVIRAVVVLGFGVWAGVLGVRGEPVLGPIGAAVFLQFAAISFRVARVTGGVVSDEALAARVGPVVTELCDRASCAYPRVALRDDSLRAAAVRRLQGRIAIVLSRPFAERVSDRELAALMAHEVVHISRGDLEAARGRMAVCVIGGLATLAGAGVAVKISVLAAYPILIAAFLVGLMITNVALSPLNRSREERADVEGALLSGDPQALAQALAVAQAFTQEMRLRVYGRAPWNWFLVPLASRLPTHPPMQKRIARLEAMR